MSCLLNRILYLVESPPNRLVLTMLSKSRTRPHSAALKIDACWGVMHHSVPEESALIPPKHSLLELCVFGVPLLNSETKLLTSFSVSLSYSNHQVTSVVCSYILLPMRTMEAVLHGQRKGSQREQSLALRIPTLGPLRIESPDLLTAYNTTTVLLGKLFKKHSEILRSKARQ